MKIADRAEALMKKKNLEGNPLTSKNSFAVLNNSDLMSKASKFGIDTNNLDFAKIDLMKDLERARTSLATKLDNSQMEYINNDTSLPLEEMKYIEWHSDGSDEEGFQKVSNKKGKRKKKKNHSMKERQPSSASPSPLEKVLTTREGISMTSSGYNLRRKCKANIKI